MKSIEILFKSIFFILILFSNFAFSKSLNKIEILGNDRISDETIKLFISLDINDEINDKTLNKILKDLYETDYFEDVSVNFEKNILSINLVPVFGSSFTMVIIIVINTVLIYCDKNCLSMTKVMINTDFYQKKSSLKSCLIILKFSAIYQVASG